MMHRSLRTMLVGGALLLAACGRQDQRTALVDSSLSRDLTTAAQLNQAPLADTVSALERTAAMAPVAAAPVAAAAAAPVRRAPARRVRRTTSTGEVASSGASASSGTYTPAPAPRTETVKHTKRDAAIGAAAGAIIGATTSRDKVKGGIIGGAAGAILGGVIGNNVDKKTRTVP